MVAVQPLLEALPGHPTHVPAALSASPQQCSPQVDASRYLCGSARSSVSCRPSCPPGAQLLQPLWGQSLSKADGVLSVCLLPNWMSLPVRAGYCKGQRKSSQMPRVKWSHILCVNSRAFLMFPEGQASCALGLGMLPSGQAVCSAS